MCNPVMAVGAAMAVAGTIAQAKQSEARAQAMISAKESTLNGVLDQNNVLAGQAQPILNTAVAAGGQPGMEAARTQSLGDRIAAIPSGPTNGINVGGVPKAVNDEIGRVGQIVSDNVKRTAKAKADLSSYGDAQSAFGNTAMDAGNKIGTISSFAKMNNAVLPAQLDSNENNAAAAHNSPIPGIIKGVGSALTSYGAMGAGGAAGGAGSYGSIGELMQAQGIGQSGFGSFMSSMRQPFFNRVGE